MRYLMCPYSKGLLLGQKKGKEVMLDNSSWNEAQLLDVARAYRQSYAKDLSRLNAALAALRVVERHFPDCREHGPIFASMYTEAMSRWGADFHKTTVDSLSEERESPASQVN